MLIIEMDTVVYFQLQLKMWELIPHIVARINDQPRDLSELSQTDTRTSLSDGH